MQLEENSKPARVFTKPIAKAKLESLENAAQTQKKALSLVRAIRYKVDVLKNNSRYGQSIAKNRIPLIYRVEFNADNLYRVELPQFWRFIYTVTRHPQTNETIIFILDILPHPEYDKLFGYAKK